MARSLYKTPLNLIASYTLLFYKKKFVYKDTDTHKKNLDKDTQVSDSK